MASVPHIIRIQYFLEEPRADTTSPELEIQDINIERNRKSNEVTYLLLNRHFLEVQHISNAQFRAPTARTAFGPTIHKPRMHVAILIKQIQRKL